MTEPRRPRSRARRELLLGCLAALLGGAASAAAQQVRLADPPRTDAQRALEVFLGRGGHALWTRDTVLAAGDTVSSHVLVLEASVRIAGRVEGDLYVVDGDLFLRTRASVGGDILVLGGGFYDSELAEVEGAITYRPNERVRVRPTAGDYEVIHEVEPRPAVELDGTYGVHIPTYQRVDALTLGVGGLARLAALPGRPEIEAVLRYKTGPDELDLSTRGSWYLSDRLRAGLAVSRATRTNDGWIRPTWYNGLAHLVAGDDDRDYYLADRIALEVEWVSAEPPVWVDAPSWSLTLSGGWEEASSLVARDVWVLFGGRPVEDSPDYPNPAIDDGSLFFARAGFEWSKRGRGGRVAFGLGVEAGFVDDIPSTAAGEELDFLLVEGRVSARRVTPWGHAVDVFAIGRAEPWGILPRQRHSTIGGVGTLPTLPLRSLRGARMVYGEATYAVPILGTAALGGLEGFVRGSAGGAGSDGGSGAAGLDFELEGSVQGGLAVRLWDFQVELGVAAGSTRAPEDPGVIAFFDVRAGRSARPSRMPRPGRGF